MSLPVVKNPVKSQSLNGPSQTAKFGNSAFCFKAGKKRKSMFWDAPWATQKVARILQDVVIPWEFQPAVKRAVACRQAETK